MRPKFIGNICLFQEAVTSVSYKNTTSTELAPSAIQSIIGNVRRDGQSAPIWSWLQFDPQSFEAPAQALIKKSRATKLQLKL